MKLDEWTLAKVDMILKEQDVNVRCPKTGRSLLHEACIEQKKEIVHYLLEKTQCDIEIRTMLGRATPLHLAVHASDRSIVFLLLSYGADARVRDRFGATPLHYCTKKSIAVHLTQFGARVLTTNLKHKTAASCIQMNEDADEDIKTFISQLAEVEYSQVKRKKRVH